MALHNVAPDASAARYRVAAEVRAWMGRLRMRQVAMLAAGHIGRAS